REPDLFKGWGVLKQIKDLRSFLVTLPGITSSMSVVDGLELIEAGLNKSAESDKTLLDEQGNIIPQETPKLFWEDPKSVAGQLPTLAMSTPTSVYVTEDVRTAAALVRTKLTPSREIEGPLDTIRDYVEKPFPPKRHVHLTGNLVLLTGAASDIVPGQ